MPVLAANQVTLAEVLEVKGGPLNEDEIWAVLSEAGKNIEHVLAKGKGKQYGQPTLVVSPNTLILSHTGHVKVSTHVDRKKSKNLAYRAPELSSRTVSPSDGAVEKMYVYSLGMTLYFAADYALNKSKMDHLSVSLGKVLLSMCEELARSRHSLRQVLAACGSKYDDSVYSKIIKGLVVLVLGSNIPQVRECNMEDKPLSRGYTSDDQHPSRSLRARYRSSLELPSPPLAYHISHGQATSEELIGPNDRAMMSPEEQPRSKNKYMMNIPQSQDIVEKYRQNREKARHHRAVTSPVVADRAIELRQRYQSLPTVIGHHSLKLPSHRGYNRTQSLDRDGEGYGGSHFDNGILRNGKMMTTGSLGNLHTAPSSDASSETSSLSDHRKSTFSSAQSSSLLSLMEGSYVPASSFTDLGSDMWGSMASLRDTDKSQFSRKWHHASSGDLRSVSQLANHDRERMKNEDTKLRWQNTDEQRKYRSEQNLVSPDAKNGGKKTKKIPKAKLRKFFGPEFVQVSEDPNQSLVNITPKREDKQQVSGRRIVTVVMLNEQRLEMTVESSTKVQELFIQVTKYIGITEKVYFGLSRIEEDEHFFLDFDTKLSKHAPTGWKENPKKFTGKYVLYFRVKFYMENLALFRHYETSHQLYLQLRSDVIKDHVYSDVETVLNLASLALQAEYGDYCKKQFGECYFKPRHYLPHRILVKLSEDRVSEKLRSLHKVQYGLSQDEAELKFIKESQKLSEYGYHFYKAQLNKKEENRPTYLGVCVQGITIFEVRQNRRKPLEQRSWATIKKLAFRKKKFYVELHREETGSKRRRLTFVSASYKRSKYLLYLCTSFHRFQMRMKARLMALDDTSIVSDQKKKLSFDSGYERPKHLNGDLEKDEKFTNGLERTHDVDSSFDSASREPNRVSSLDNTNNSDVIGQSTSGSSLERMASPPYVLSSSPVSPSGFSENTPPPKVKEKTADIIMSPDRKIKAIQLKKDARGALGLTVVGGEDSRRLHLGIFIKKISPGSVSYDDGRLQVGDRILAVNGKSLEYVTHEEAVQALKNTPQNVELLVSQSTKTDSNIDMAVLSTPVKRPSLSQEHRKSPYFVEQHSFPSKLKNNHDNDDVADRELNPSYRPRSVSTQGSTSPHYLRRFSRSTSEDMPMSNPSSPEQGTFKDDHPGIKLPGMTDGQIDRVQLKSRLRTSQISQPSLESPGSFASYGEKINLKNSEPDLEVGRKLSSFSAFSHGALSRSRSNSGTSSAVLISGRTSEDNHAMNDIISNHGSHGSIDENDLQELPARIMEDHEGQRESREDEVPIHFTVELDKVSGSLGLNVMGGMNTNVKDGAIFVKSLYPNGPADLDGRIRVGHKILSVNGISLQGVTHIQAVETIKRAPIHAILVIEDNCKKTAERKDHGALPKKEQESIFEVVLMKGIGGLGMSLVGGADCRDDYGDKLRIKAMFPGQPAENSEKLHVGDIILAANGVSLVGKTSREAINVLRDQPTRVVLTVNRDPSSIPPGLLRRGSFSQSLDPNEVLSAIDTKLQAEDSHETKTGNDTSSEARDTRGISEARASASRQNSQVKQDTDSRDNFKGCKSTSQDDAGTLEKETPQDNVNTSVDNDVVPDNDSLVPAAEHMSHIVFDNNGGMVPKNNHQSRDVETMGTTSMTSNKQEEPYSEGGVSSDDNIIDGDDLSHNFNTIDASPSMKVTASSPLKYLGSVSKTGGGDERGEKKERKRSSLKNTKETLAPQEEVLDVVLHKGSAGLGFTLAGGADTVGGCFVRDIIGDPARSDGRLRPKDQIVMVNGQDTTNKKHMEAVDILRSTRNEVHLVIRRRPDKVKSKTKDGLDIETISVIRTTRGVVGLTLAEDKQGQIYAAEVLPDEPAAKHGGLKRGDIILEINGERVDDTDLKFAVECLERARPVVTLVIKQFRNETESKYVVCSPAESDHEVPSRSLPAHASGHSIKTTLVPPLGISTHAHSSYYSEFSPSSEELSPDDLPSGFLPSEHSMPSEQSSPNFLPYKSKLPEPITEPFSSQPLDGSLSPAQQDYEETQVESASADDNITSRDATHEPENEDYPSDDDDLLLKEEIIITMLEKGPRGLGFSLFSGQTVHDSPGLFIRNIQPNSVVAEDGKIMVGDQLMKVNGEDVERLDHSEVITLLRSLSGVIRLELLRMLDGDDGDDDDEESPRQLPDVSNETHVEVVDNSVSPVTTPDFAEDVGIVLNALQAKQNLLAPNVSFPSPDDKLRERTISALEQSSGDERPESWPRPPSSLELNCNMFSEELSKEKSPNTLRIVEKTDNSDDQIGTSEDDSTSVNFSEDDFLDDIEDMGYTPSPEAKRVRSVGDVERSRIPVKSGSSLSTKLSPKILRQENVETSPLQVDKYIPDSGIPVDNTTAETMTNDTEGAVSPLIHESFLSASQAVSSSQPTTPEFSPPLPTTPLPSDEDLSLGHKMTPRDQARTMRERFEKVVRLENAARGRFDLPLSRKSPLVNQRPKLVDSTVPLIEILVSKPSNSGVGLLSVIEELQEAVSSGKAESEFQNFREMMPVDNCPSGKRALNKNKNRYKNVLPYEKTRVVLHGDDETDYINANYINISVGSETYDYIATQGPLPATTDDFWRMVWEQHCQVIAMVTNDMECGRVKCHRYWPESPELPVKINSSLEVHLESEETHPNYVLRNIRIENINEKQSFDIVHLNFTSWPDHGVPESAYELVEFIKLFRESPSIGPRVVHCSAGIGRTGTLLTIDTCMKHIERGIKFDVCSIAQNLREQRPGMIQTKDQYLFCYQACIEILQSLQE